MMAPESSPQPPPEPSSPDAQPLDQLLHNPWVMLGLLFLVTGALGIPLLWISRAFSTWTKVLLTVVVTVYTALLIWGVWLVMVWAYYRVFPA